MTIRTFTIIVSLDDKNDEYKDDLEASIAMHRELQGEPFTLVHVYPGITEPQPHVCAQHRALKNV